MFKINLNFFSTVQLYHFGQRDLLHDFLSTFEIWIKQKLNYRQVVRNLDSFIHYIHSQNAFHILLRFLD